MTETDVIDILDRHLDKKLSNFIRNSWYVLIGLFVTTAGTWFSLYFQVQNIQKEQINQVEVNKEAIAANQRQLDTLRTDYKSDLKEIKEDLKFIRNSI